MPGFRVQLIVRYDTYVEADTAAEAGTRAGDQIRANAAIDALRVTITDTRIRRLPSSEESR